MRAPTHACFGFFFGGIVASFYADNPDIAFGLNGLTGAALFVVVLGSVIPDIDSKHAFIAKILLPLAVIIQKRWGHREGVHSAVGLGAAMLFFFFLAQLVFFGFRQQGHPLGTNHSGLLSVLFGAGFLSHLLLDTWTKAGVRWTWPSWDRWMLPPGERYRARSGDWRVECPIILISLVLFGWLILPGIRKGAVASVRDEFGAFEGLRSAYLEMPGREMAVTFAGFFEDNKAPVAGRGLVLAERGSFFVIFFDGQVHHLGVDQGNIRLIDGQIAALDRTPQVQTATFFRADLAAIVADLASGGTVLISGRLDADRPFVITRPLAARGITASATTLEMSFAQPADLARLQVRLKADGQTVAELAHAEATARQTEDSLLAARQRTTGLYERERLRERIQTVRQERGRLEKALAAQVQEDSTARFSGQLSVRMIPSF
jgi:membrane-bound metal-dependent hydrolase YbcI (DUF457 family)